MAAKQIVFFLLLAIVTLYAGVRGKGPERIAVGMMVAAAIATALLPYNDGTNYDHLFLDDFGIDVVLLGGLLTVAAIANRFWPMWMSSLQLLTVGVHVVKVIDPTVLPIVYAWSANKMAYVMFLVLLGGTRGLRVRIEQHGPEASWSPWRW